MTTNLITGNSDTCQAIDPKMIYIKVKILKKMKLQKCTTMNSENVLQWK